MFLNESLIVRVCPRSHPSPTHSATVVLTQLGGTPSVSSDMAAPDCKLMVWSDPPRAFVKIVGRGTMHAAPDFEALLKRLETQGHASIVFELSSCVLMDSTFVGKLVHFALRRAERTPASQGCLVLVNPGEHITTLLDTMYVLEMFEVLQDATISAPNAGVESLDCQGHSREELNRCCLEAHRVLAALDPSNAAKFQDVIRFLETQPVR